MKLLVKKIKETVVLPVRAHPDDAGMDIFCHEEFILSPHETRKVLTGFALQIPSGYVGYILDKSSVSSKGIKVVGGVIDTGYTGEWVVTLHNLTDAPYPFEVGNKIAQIVIQKIELCNLEEVEELDVTPRNEKGFGSTGK